MNGSGGVALNENEYIHEILTWVVALVEGRLRENVQDGFVMHNRDL